MPIRFYILILILIYFFDSYAQKNYLPKNSIEQAVTSMMNENALKNASLSFKVIDLSNDSAIASYNANTSLVPASTMKVVTTAAAISALGSYKTFKTQLQYDGTIDSATCTLNGNIYIKGGGDPTLGSKYFLKKGQKPDYFMEKWVEELEKLNIHNINGRVIADASYFSNEMIPSTWTWGDMGNYYGAGPSGLTIYDNLLNIQFKTGKKQGDSTRVTCITPYLPEVTIDNKVTASNINKDNAYVYAAPYVANRFVTGTLPKNRASFTVKGTIYDPPYQAAYDFEYYLLKNNIQVAKPATTIRRLTLERDVPTGKRTTFYTHTSASIARISYWTNHTSVNLFAEHLLNKMGANRYKDGSNYSGALAVKNHWKNKFNTTGMYIGDGSGLSRHNALSASHLTGVLRHMKRSKYYKSFYSSLPIAGKSGTMKRIGRGTRAQHNVRAKSGTMSRVKSYAGYATTKSGKKVAFAIIVNNFNCYSSTITKKLEKLMVAIANYNG